jgi:solute carrier family 10 (sodium/bile acid cotransporter), member 7
VRSILKNHWFLIAVGSASLFGYFRPQWGIALQEYDVFGAGIFLSFFVTGLGLETQAILRQVKEFKAPVAALVSSLVIYPLIAWILAGPMLDQESFVGICIIATAPVTVSSGTILTSYARGNVALSLLICVLTNFLCIFTIPLLLGLLLGLDGSIDLPILQMLGGLGIKVLLPLLLGQAVRPALRTMIRRHARSLSVFQSAIIFLIIFNAVSSSAENLHTLGLTVIRITLFVVCLQLLMLAMNYFLSRALHLDRASIIAFTIHTSQKTLTVSYIVWAGYFASAYPNAFIPAIICQLVQMAIGSLIAESMRAGDG